MESFISPLSQELAEADALSPGAKRALEEMLTAEAQEPEAVAEAEAPAEESAPWQP